MQNVKFDSNFPKTLTREQSDVQLIRVQIFHILPQVIIEHPGHETFQHRWVYLALIGVITENSAFILAPVTSLRLCAARKNPIRGGARQWQRWRGGELRRSCPELSKSPRSALSRGIHSAEISRISSSNFLIDGRRNERAPVTFRTSQSEARVLEQNKMAPGGFSRFWKFELRLFASCKFMRSICVINFITEWLNLLLKNEKKNVTSVSSRKITLGALG